MKFDLNLVDDCLQKMAIVVNGFFIFYKDIQKCRGSSCMLYTG